MQGSSILEKIILISFKKLQYCHLLAIYYVKIEAEK